MRRFWTQAEAAAEARDGSDDGEGLGFDPGLTGLEALDWVRACNAVLTASVRTFSGAELGPTLELLSDMARPALLCLEAQIYPGGSFGCVPA